MSSQRLNLQTLLVATLGSTNVYFQPPPSTQIQYPCIVYERSEATTKFADNSPYNVQVGYQVTLVDKNPDTTVLEKIMLLPKCRYVRHFVSDNLNHDVFIIYV